MLIDRPSPLIVARAAEWAALFDDVTVTDADKAAFERWCAEHPQHRPTFERMAGVVARFDGLDLIERRTIAAVDSGRRLRRRVAGGMACLALLLAGGLAARQSYAVRVLWPDQRTGAGEQRQLALADGSRLTADTRTRFDDLRNGDTREILLFEGQLMAEVSRDPARPFVIRTREGTATALGTAYSVRRDGAGRSVVTVIESRVRLCPAKAADHCRTLFAGQRAAITPDAIGPVETVDPEIAALWTTGWIEVHDRPLPDLLGELARYRPAPIRFDASELAAVRVTGSYPLTDPDAALRSIAAAGALRIEQASDGAITLRRAAR